MTKSSRTAQFVCRSCRQAGSRPTTQVRAFSSSTSRPSTIPSFQPTSSPELDALLLDWRRRVFTPAALNTTYQSLIYKTKRKSLLENDPGVRVTMADGEEVQLEPMNRFDKPNKSDSLAEIARILSTSESPDVWLQLPSFLEGMALAKQQIPTWWLEKITRKANEQGKAGVIKQCAAMVKKTGLSLSMKPVTRELLLGVHQRLIAALQAGESFEQENSFAEGLARMMEAQEHCAKKVDEGRNVGDMRKDLTVLGVLLEVATARAIHVHKGLDIEGTVGSLAQKLVAMTGFDFLKSRPDNHGRSLEDLIPLSNGVRMVQKVNGLKVAGKGKNAEMELKAALKDRLTLLDRAISEETVKVEADAKAMNKPRRALNMLEELKKL